MLKLYDIHHSGMKQSGFTLVELMISMVIGLLVIAATTQLLVTSQSTVTSQQAGSSLQDDGSFGITALNRALRMANYGAGKTDDQNQYVMNTKTPHGGIVLTAAVSGDDDKVNKNLRVIVTNAGGLISGSGTASSTTFGSSNLDGQFSDQLVTQRKATIGSNYDCQGREIVISAGDPDQFIVERYFLKEDSIGQANEPTKLALRCKATSYSLNSSTWTLAKDTSNADIPLSGDGDVIISRVDHFRYLLGIETSSDNTVVKPNESRVRYVTPSDYKNNHNNAKIVSIRYAIVARSATPTSGGISNSDQKFNLLDKTGLTLKSTVSNKAQYDRQVYESTVLFRNARG